MVPYTLEGKEGAKLECQLFSKEMNIRVEWCWDRIPENLIDKEEFTLFWNFMNGYDKGEF